MARIEDEIGRIVSVMSFSPLADGYVLHGHAQPRVQTRSGNWARWEKRRSHRPWRGTRGRTAPTAWSCGCGWASGRRIDRRRRVARGPDKKRALLWAPAGAMAR